MSMFGLLSLYPSLLGIETQKKRDKITILTRKPQSHVKILMLGVVYFKLIVNFALKNVNV